MADLTKGTATVKLPEGIKAIEYVNDDMIGDHLVIHFDNGLSLGVDALALGDSECQAVLYARRDPEAGQYDVLANLEFGVERKPSARIFADEWQKFQRRGK